MDVTWRDKVGNEVVCDNLNTEGDGEDQGKKARTARPLCNT